MIDTCKRCNRDSLVYLRGNSRIQYLEREYYTELIYCASCGEIQNKLPLLDVFAELLQNKIDELNEFLLSLYQQGMGVKLELEYPGDPDEPERYGRLFLRLNEIKVSDRRMQI